MLNQQHYKTIFWLIIVISTFLVYSSSLGNKFTNWDDEKFLTDNNLVRSLSLANIEKIWTTPVQHVYVPLSILSAAVEYHFAGLNPFVYHLDNLLLHLAVTSLVFFFVLRLGLSLPAAGFAALLFGLHPMHVESVAWVTERKDVLYALFYMLALSSYVKYLDQKNRKDYFFSILFGILSILSKPMALSLPLVLFLLDWFKKRKVCRDSFLDKLPHVAYIIPITWITYALHTRVPGKALGQGILIWSWTLIFYFKKFFFPSQLIPVYALPQPVALTNPEYLFAAGLLIVLVGSIMIFRKNRWFLFGLAYFFVSIFFLLRFDSSVDKNIVADRFIYLPSLGFCVFLGYAAQESFRFLRVKNVKAAQVFSTVLVGILCMLGAKTVFQVNVWKDSLALWNHELRYSPLEYMAYANRGEFFVHQKKFDLALKDYNEALRIKPDYTKALNNRGMLYKTFGKNGLAEEDFKRAIFAETKSPSGTADVLARAYNNLGLIYFEEQKLDVALQCFNESLKLDTTIEQTYNNRALVYDAQGKPDLAFADYNKAIMVNPKFAEGYNNRAIFYKNKNEFTKALNDFNIAIYLNPTSADFYYNRGNFFRIMNRQDLALKDYDKALELNPRHKLAAQNRQVVTGGTQTP
ncbi:MAG: tetratricopeptide repeat protein [Candidatus Omnitrophica bacterium]|nr:tetratricopeptide repeat protein [Candidatus Omnitrophota bacterium]